MANKYTLGDYVLKNWNDWDRVPRDPFTIGNAILYTLQLTTAYTAVIYAVGVLAISAVTSFALRALAPKPPSQRKGQLVNSREATAPAAFIYGRIRTGGNITFIKSEGTENRYLHQIIVLAAHEVDAIESIYLNDEVVTINGSHLVTSGPWNSKVRIRIFDGSQTTVDSELETLTGDSNFIGENIAFLHVRYEYDQDVFADGLPLVTALIRGKKVYDPRDGTTAWSDNAALCIRDYLVSDYGLNDSAIDDTYFSAAANDCDEDIPLTSAWFSSWFTEKRYTINGVVFADESIDTVLGDMTSACNGTLFWGVGAWKLKVGVYTSPVKDFDLSDLRGPISLDTRTSIRDSFNTVRGTFVNRRNGYITEDYEQVTSATFKTEDGGEELALDLSLPYTTSFATAKRLAKQTLYRSREQMTFSADFGLEALSVEVGDIVTFTNDRYGWDQKEFEVVGWSFSANQDAGDLRVSLTLRETSEAAFTWTAEENEIINNNTTLPENTAGLTVNNLSATLGDNIQQRDGTFVHSAILTWAQVDNAFANNYEVQWKVSTATSYSSTLTTNNAVEISPLVSTYTYTFRVRAITSNGYRGPWTSINLDIDGDTDPPALPTSATAVGGYGYITLNWTRPADPDFQYVEIWENTSNTTSGAVKVGESSGDSFTRFNLGTEVTKYYFLKSVDFSGNVSEFAGSGNWSGGINYATTAYLADDFEDGVRQLFIDQGLDIIESVSSLPSNGDFVGQQVFLTTDGKLYNWTGSAWTLTVAAVEAPDISGQIGSLQIAERAVTNAQIALNAIQGDVIATGAITETKINDDSISTPKLKAGSIVGGKLAADCVTTDKILAGTITASKMYLSNFSSVFIDTFEENLSLGEWVRYSGNGELLIVSGSDVELGGKALRVGTNSGDDQWWAIHNTNIPFDPNVTYRLRVRAKKAAGSGTAYFGWAGVAADGTTLVNISGSNTSSSQHYHCASGVSLGAGYVEYVGYTSGYGVTSGSGYTGESDNPSVMHPDVRYIRPLILVNYSGQSGISYIDHFSVDIMSDASLIVDGAINADKIAARSITAGNIATGTITAEEIAGNTITGDLIVGNTITGGLLATSGIITDSAQIGNSVIENANIGNLEVDAAKIAGNAISNVYSGPITTGSHLGQTFSANNSASDLTQGVGSQGFAYYSTPISPSEWQKGGWGFSYTIPSDGFANEIISVSAFAMDPTTVSSGVNFTVALLFMNTDETLLYGYIPLVKYDTTFYARTYSVLDNWADEVIGNQTHLYRLANYIPAGTTCRIELGVWIEGTNSGDNLALYNVQNGPSYIACRIHQLRR